MAMLASDLNVDSELTHEVLVHLSAQLDSARRMQAIVPLVFGMAMPLFIGSRLSGSKPPVSTSV